MWVKGYQCDGGSKEEQNDEIGGLSNVVGLLQFPAKTVEEDHVEEEGEAELPIE